MAVTPSVQHHINMKGIDFKVSITITKMIAHDMKLKLDKLSYSPHEFDLSTVPQAVFDFFTEHVETSRNDRHIKSCNFIVEHAFVKNSVGRIYQSLGDSEQFVEITKEITNDLFNKTKDAGSRSDGALFFILYNHDGEDFLGIMKMDPNEGIQINTDTFTLEVQENMLPNPKDKLHKCAFIKKETSESSDVDLYVLDKQQNPGEISKYFLNTFLQSEEIINDKIMTKRVIDKLSESFLSIIPPEKAMNFKLSIEKTFVNGRLIDLDLDLEGLIAPYVEEDAVKAGFIEDFKTELRKEHEDINFQFVVEKKPTVIQYFTQNKKIKFEFPVEFFNTHVNILKESNEEYVFKITGVNLIQRQK